MTSSLNKQINKKEQTLGKIQERKTVKESQQKGNEGSEKSAGKGKGKSN